MQQYQGDLRHSVASWGDIVITPSSCCQFFIKVLRPNSFVLSWSIMIKSKGHIYRQNVRCLNSQSITFSHKQINELWRHYTFSISNHVFCCKHCGMHEKAANLSLFMFLWIQKTCGLGFGCSIFGLWIVPQNTNAATVKRTNRYAYIVCETLSIHPQNPNIDKWNTK